MEFNTPLSPILYAKVLGSGGGGGPTTAVLYTAQTLSDAQQTQARTNIGAVSADDIGSYELKPTETTISGTTATISAAANTVYNCGELTSLAVDSFPQTGKFWIWFTSGATPTTVTGIDNFTPEANKKYRVFVENGYATFDAWSIGGGS